MGLDAKQVEYVDPIILAHNSKSIGPLLQVGRVDRMCSNKHVLLLLRAGLGRCPLLGLIYVEQKETYTQGTYKLFYVLYNLFLVTMTSKCQSFMSWTVEVRFLGDFHSQF